MASKEREGGRKYREGEKSVRTRKRKRKRKRGSYKESASLRAAPGSRDKLHLNNSIFTTVRRLYANTEEVCVLVHACTLTRTRACGH